MLNKRIIRQYSSLIFKSKEITAIWILFLATVIGFMLRQLITGETNAGGLGILAAMSTPLSFSIFVFAVFAFVSFEMGYKIRRYNLDETVSAISYGKNKLFLAQGVVFLLIALVFFLVFNLWTVLLYAKFNFWDGAFALQIFLNMILSFFLLPCCAVIMGTALSLLCKRINGCLFLVLFVLLGSPLINDIGYVIYDLTKINIYPFLKLFDVFPPSLSWSPVYAFGASILPYRWETAFFWIFLFTAIIIFKSNKNKTFGKSAAAVSAVLSFCCIVLALIPSSKVLVASDDPVDSIMANYEYYFTENNEVKTEAKEFNITNYDLDIAVKNKLNVTAELSVDKNNLDEYKFTMYHGFKIKSVENGDGEPMSFTQSGDYFTVHNEDKINIEKIIIKYSGYSATNYSNMQGIYLPGYFPYYPHSGYSVIYSKEFNGLQQVVTDSPVPFTVKIKSTMPVYCNLEETEKNVYSGTTTGVTLLAGLYDCYTKDSISVVYPYLSTNFSEAALSKFINDYYGTEAFPKNIKKVFITPSINNSSPYEAYCQFSDHIDAINILGFDKYYNEQIMDPNKQVLYSIYKKYLEYPEEVRGIAEDAAKNFEMAYPESADLSFEEKAELYPPNAFEYLVYYLDRVGEEEGLKRLSEYFADESDTRHWKDFVMHDN